MIIILMIVVVLLCFLFLFFLNMKYSFLPFLSLLAYSPSNALCQHLCKNDGKIISLAESRTYGKMQSRICHFYLVNIQLKCHKFHLMII